MKVYFSLLLISLSALTFADANMCHPNAAVACAKFNANVRLG